MSAVPSVDAMRKEAVRKARQRLSEIEANKARYDADLQTFAADCLTIRPKEGADKLLRFNAVQRHVNELLDEQKRRTGKVRAIILKARQPGVSTYVGARFYHRISRNPGLRAFILTHEQDATDNIFAMVQRYQDKNPQAPVAGKASAKELYFGDLDSGFSVGTAGGRSVGRSFTFQLFHGSEVAYWPNAEDHAAGALQAVPDAANTEVILESTANGIGGLFYNMAMAAQRGISEYQLIFVPWFDHEEYSRKAPKGWRAPTALAEYGHLYGLSRDQLYWMYFKNIELATAEGEPPDEICWKFRQEYPATVDEAFRASRQGSFISGADVQRARTNELGPQDHAPLLFGVDLATGGDGEGGDDNVIIDRQGRVAGGFVYERWNDKNTISVAAKLAALIDDLEPDMTFIDTGGGGAQVYDILKDRGYEHLTLVGFGEAAEDDRKYFNKRAEMYGRLRDWLKDVGGADIPDDDVLDGEITSVKAKEDYNSRIKLDAKDKVRKDIGHSPDGSDALVTTFAETVQVIDHKKLNPLNEPGSGSRDGWMAS